MRTPKAPRSYRFNGRLIRVYEAYVPYGERTYGVELAIGHFLQHEVERDLKSLNQPVKEFLKDVKTVEQGRALLQRRIESRKALKSAIDQLNKAILEIEAEFKAGEAKRARMREIRSLIYKP